MTAVWQISGTVPYSNLAVYEEIFAALDAGVAVALGAGNKVSLTVYVAGDTPKQRLESVFETLRQLTGEAVNWHIDQQQMADWYERMVHDFPGTVAGDFYLHSGENSQRAEEVPADKIPLALPPSLAFGSNHPTTRMCLELLRHCGASVLGGAALDMGCGSGVLAIAAAKSGFASVMAVDNEAESLSWSQQNVDTNGVASTVQVIASDGFAAVPKQARYQLIFANIFMQPLLAWAPKVVRHLAPGGVLIVSGFQSQQADAIIAAYAEHGLTVAHRLDRTPWVACVLKRQ